MVDKILDLVDLGRPLRRATCELKDATCRAEALIEELEEAKGQATAAPDTSIHVVIDSPIRVVIEEGAA